jgi:hypothetical protein
MCTLIPFSVPRTNMFLFLHACIAVCSSPVRCNISYTNGPIKYRQLTHYLFEQVTWADVSPLLCLLT